MKGGLFFRKKLDNGKVLCLGVGFLGVGSGGGGVLVVEEEEEEEEEEEDGKFCILAGEEETPKLVLVPGAGYGRNTARPVLCSTPPLCHQIINIFVFFVFANLKDSMAFSKDVYIFA